MRNILFIQLFLCCLQGAFTQEIRIMTYNIHHGEDMKGKVDIAQIAEVINRYKPDIVAFQEVDSVTNRNGKVDQMAELGRLTGMQQAYGRNFAYDGGSYGLGILSRFPIAETKSYRLPYYPDDANGNTRLMFMTTIQLAKNKQFYFGTVHLDYKQASQRKIQADDMLLQLEKAGNIPIIIAGDFNAAPGEDCISVIESKYTELINHDSAFTYPADTPTIKIDYIFLSKNNKWKPVQQQVIDETNASDHRPVLGVVRLEK